MTSMDPLDLFRQAISASTPPTLLDAASEPAESLQLATYISFPTEPPTNITKETATRYTSKADSKDEFYNIGQLWLAWTEKDAGVRDYLMKGQAGGVGYVGIADRRGVVEYLQGESDGGARIVSATAAEEPTQAAASATVEALPGALESTAEAGPSKPAAPTKRRYEVDHADLEFCKRLRAEEIELRDRNSVLRSSNGGKIHTFDSILKTGMSEKIRALRKALEASGGKNQAQPQAAYDSSKGKKAKTSHPIIMISSSPTALITLWNVKKFLEQGIFEPSDVARANEAAQGNIKPDDVVPIMRKRTGPNGDVMTKYYVVDGVDSLQKFGQDAWDRVVCVLTTGQAWQFKPYKWQDPKALFRHVKGVYFQWNNEPANPVVKDWNVAEMRIDRNKRHIDRQIVAEFWRQLDAYKKR